MTRQQKTDILIAIMILFVMILCASHAFISGKGPEWAIGEFIVWCIITSILTGIFYLVDRFILGSKDDKK